MSRPVGMAGVVAALSVTSDLTRGHPPGEAMRACLLATELARQAGLSDPDRAAVYYATLLRFAGCAATSVELAAAYGGDDVAVRSRGDLIDPTRTGEALGLLLGLGRGPGKLRMLAQAPGAARLYTEAMRADCEVGAQLTRRLHLPDAVRQAVLDGFERFDGRGAPERKTGMDIAEPARYAQVGYAAVMFDTVGGGELAAQTVARWSGRALDPVIAAIFSADPADLLARSDPDDLWAAVVDAEPHPHRVFRDQSALDDALAGYGDAADLKSAWFHGHSSGVARLAGTAARTRVELPAELVHRAGLVHDLGRVAVPTGVWARPGALRSQEWELVRLHPYRSARILAASPVLAPLGELAGRHHERTDGSGYPAGIRAADLDEPARLLAAADALHALLEPRPHRPALDLAAATKALAEMPLDREAIRAVLRAADAPRPVFPPVTANLTERELEVLRLLVSGRTKRQVAAELVISHATVHSHTVHIYDKCGVSTRAGLAMFAMRHGLAGPP